MKGVSMTRRGRKLRLDLESEYWLLLAAGVGTVEACRIVGVGRKTGYRWRAEHGGVPPAKVAEDARSNRYLSLLERQRIATLHERGLSIRTIADRLGRAASTISRELRRNVRPHDRGCYDADLAHARARQRARRLRRARLILDSELRAMVQAKLELDWSPVQIAVWLRSTFPHRRGWHVSHETIYQALYHAGKGGLSRELTRRLRTGRPLRTRRRRPDQRRCRFVAPATLIEHRPSAAHERKRVGDWEGDLIVGRGGRSAIATLVDRRSRYVRLVHLPGNRTADTVRDALIDTFSSIPETVRWTLTWDQGAEMAHHEQIATLLRQGVFFAHPGCPCQRGTNENTNGLARQYFPKNTDLAAHTPHDLRVVEERLNTRPRQTLGWHTPAEVFTAALAP
ncbi:IS30 family transposase [Saccharopolyspora sp. NFXS83]|uniref:IS30 family transposase n=1 Tax=Saccharopolyspora sp. NFXS83 TaxID=2993560 RepID=UPI00224AA480|nr:IS30 family transposase [Saccharopolyspora sp. NFXS83]MCX2729407.1 IS30 family transposase [Saccharopolyspora sp. NFXS83]